MSDRQLPMERLAPGDVVVASDGSFMVVLKSTLRRGGAGPKVAVSWLDFRDGELHRTFWWASYDLDTLVTVM